MYVLLHIFLPLGLGGVIYLLFNNARTNISAFVEQVLGLDLPLLDTKIPYFLIYQLPDALWAYAFCATFMLIWQRVNAAIIAFLSFILCTFYEIMQYFDWTNGTFDVWDIVVMGVACWFAYFTKMIK